MTSQLKVGELHVPTLLPGILDKTQTQTSAEGQYMPNKYTPLEKYLRDLPLTQEEVTLTFERIEQILNDSLPLSAHEDRPWWGNQKPGTYVEPIAWMDAGWMVDTANLKEKWVRFVRQ